MQARLLATSAIGIALATAAQAQSTRAQMNAANDAAFYACGVHCITPTTLHSYHALEVSAYGLVNDPNTWLAAQTFAGPVTINGALTSAGPVTINGALTLGTALSVANGGTGAATAAGARTNLGLPEMADPRAYMSNIQCTSATDVSAGVAAAIAAGYKRIRLPANCMYIPPSNVVPAGIEIDGDDWNTSIISSSNQVTQFLQAGAGVIVRNVGIMGQFCHDVSNPAMTSKICPVGNWYNLGSDIAFLNNWVREALVIRTAPTTTPDGLTVTDVPGMAVTQTSASGDGIFSGTAPTTSNGFGSASAIRITTGATSPGSDYGVYILNGDNNTSASTHQGIFVKEFSDNSHGARSIHVTRSPLVSGQDVAPSLYVDDTSAVGNGLTSPLLAATVAHQVSGNLISIFHGAGSYTGSVFIANMGSGAATYAGDFLDMRNGDVKKFNVSSAGNITAAGTGSLATASNNGIAWTGAASGSPPILFATSAVDADVPFRVAGKGADGVIVGQFKSTSDPTTADITIDHCVDWHNNTTGTSRHVCNSSGAILYAEMTRGLPPVSLTGFCTAPVIQTANGTAAFEIVIGTGCAASTGQVNLPAATTGYGCTFRNITNPNANKPDQTGVTTTSVSVTNYSRTTGAPVNWTAGDTLVATCTVF